MENNEFNAAMAKFAESFTPMKHLPALRAQLEVELPSLESIYQRMVIFLRCRYNTTGNGWPGKPVNAPVATHYPNITAEIEASGYWMNRLVSYAEVSEEIMAAAIEDNEELSLKEMRGLARCFDCDLEYLAKPVLSLVDPNTDDGKDSLHHLAELVDQTQGLFVCFPEQSEGVLHEMENGTVVTYARYRWACSTRQSALDSKERATARKHRTRTTKIADSGLDPEEYAAAKLRNEEQFKQKKLAEITDYANSVNIKESRRTTSKELLALASFAEQDLYGALILAILYGRAIGYRSAGSEANV